MRSYYATKCDNANTTKCGNTKATKCGHTMLQNYTITIKCDNTYILNATYKSFISGYKLITDLKTIGLNQRAFCCKFFKQAIKHERTYFP